MTISFRVIAVSWKLTEKQTGGWHAHFSREVPVRGGGAREHVPARFAGEAARTPQGII